MQGKNQRIAKFLSTFKQAIEETPRESERRGRLRWIQLVANELARGSSNDSE